MRVKTFEIPEIYEPARPADQLPDPNKGTNILETPGSRGHD